MIFFKHCGQTPDPEDTSVVCTEYKTRGAPLSTKLLSKSAECFPCESTSDNTQVHS